MLTLSIKTDESYLYSIRSWWSMRTVLKNDDAMRCFCACCLYPSTFFLKSFPHENNSNKISFPMGSWCKNFKLNELVLLINIDIPRSSSSNIKSNVLLLYVIMMDQTYSRKKILIWVMHRISSNTWVNRDTLVNYLLMKHLKRSQICDRFA